MFEATKLFLKARAWFDIHWVVRKLAWSFFGTLILWRFLQLMGAVEMKAIAGSGALALILALIKEITESMGQEEPLWKYFMAEGMKDLAPVFVGISVAIMILVAKAHGL